MTGAGVGAGFSGVGLSGPFSAGAIGLVVTFSADVAATIDCCVTSSRLRADIESLAIGLACLAITPESGVDGLAAVWLAGSDFPAESLTSNPLDTSVVARR